MKKIIFIFALLLSFVCAEAQIATATVLYPNTYGAIVSPTASANIYKITNTTAGYLLFKAPMPKGSKQDFTIRMDSVSGNLTNVAVELYGQKSALKGDWTKIGSTVNWKGTTADTTMVISNATFNYYQNTKLVFTGTGTGVVKLTQAQGKWWLE